MSEAKADHGLPSSLIGKVVAVYGRTQEQGGMVQVTALERLADRSFIVGQVVARKTKEWAGWAGVSVWLPIDDISKLAVFDSVEAAKRTFGEL
jgi:hypothetical protein